MTQLTAQHIGEPQFTLYTDAEGYVCSVLAKPPGPKIHEGGYKTLGTSVLGPEWTVVLPEGMTMQSPNRSQDSWDDEPTQERAA